MVNTLTSSLCNLSLHLSFFCPSMKADYFQRKVHRVQQPIREHEELFLVHIHVGTIS